MSDVTPQLVSGAAILLSFFAGYKYALRVLRATELSAEDVQGKSSSKDGASTSAQAAPEPLSFRDHGDYKMIFVVRNDLKMGKGKIAAQCGHAAVGAYQSAVKRQPQVVRAWENSGCAKIAVKCDSKEQLLSLRQQALLRQMNACMIRDAGRTQIEPNSITVLAIGPARVSDLDEITGHLKLL